MSADDYAYRQAGIYIAEHSHIILALWDGKLPENEFECGIFEMMRFALDHKFLDRDRLFASGILNDGAVLWLNVRRKGGGWSENLPKKRGRTALKLLSLQRHSGVSQ